MWVLNFFNGTKDENFFVLLCIYDFGKRYLKLTLGRSSWLAEVL